MGSNQSTNNIKVFISSTFRDLTLERDYLVRKVFPDIRDELDVNVSEVDLRWGITDEESRQGKVVDLCLQYLYNSRPYFVGILGERYGSVLKSGGAALSALVQGAYPDLQRDMKIGLSITEIEIMNGVFRATDDHRPKAIFFIKETSAPAYGETDRDFEKLQLLKGRIRAQKTFPVYDFDDDLTVFDKVKEFIVNDLKEYKRQPERTEEGDLACAMLRRLAEYRKMPPTSVQLLDRLMPVVERAKPTAVLEGAEGIGKSTLLAQLGAGYKGSSRLFLHFYGGEVRQPATNMLFLGTFLHMAKMQLKAIQQEQSQAGGLGGWLKRSFSETPNLDHEPTLIKEIGRHKWCIVLDDANAFRYHHITPMLYIVANVYNVFSYLKQEHGVDVDYRVLVADNAGSPYSINDNRFEKFSMPFRSTVDPSRFVDGYFSAYSKHLDSRLRQQLIDSSLMGHPRSMLVACEFMRENVSHEQLPQFVERLQKFQYVRETYSLYIDKLREEFPEKTLVRVVTLITMFACGMAKNDLEQLSGLSSFDFGRLWAVLGKLMATDSHGESHWVNDSVSHTLEEAFCTGGDQLRKSLAEECRRHFSSKVFDCYSPEDLQRDIMKNWWMYKTELITTLPNRSELHRARLSGRLDDMQLYSMLVKQGAFGLDNVRRVYNAHRVSLLMELNKKKEGSDYDEALKRIERYHPPRLTDIHCYIESLRWLGDYKALEDALVHPKVLNYAFLSMLYIDCWFTAVEKGGAKLCRQELTSSTAMLMVASMLRDQEAIAYYRKNYKPKKQ